MYRESIYMLSDRDRNFGRVGGGGMMALSKFDSSTE